VLLGIFGFFPAKKNPANAGVFMGSFFAELSSGPPQPTPGHRSATATTAMDVGDGQVLHHFIRLPNFNLGQYDKQLFSCQAE
jgi:hypothetical protein